MKARGVTADARTSCGVGLCLVLLSVASAVAWATGWASIAVGVVGSSLILRGVLVSLAATLGSSTLLVSGRPPGPDVAAVPESDRAAGTGSRTKGAAETAEELAEASPPAPGRAGDGHARWGIRDPVRICDSRSVTRKEYAPSADRNKDEILAVLPRFLPARGTILEIACGTGQHAVHFAARFPEARWQPTDRRGEVLPSVRAWAAEAGVANVLEPLELDVTWAEWPVEAADAIVTINMLHISPWSTCEAWLAGAARVLRPGAPLYYYGAMFRRDRETAPSNLAFDRSLRARDPAWGVRRLEDVVASAEGVGLALDTVLDMPNNNHSVVFRQPPVGGGS